MGDNGIGSTGAPFIITLGSGSAEHTCSIGTAELPFWSCVTTTGLSAGAVLPHGDSGRCLETFLCVTPGGRGFLALGQ